ncbi:hypothetical protein P152DRAFT_15310 [Eremomyces bilateralis CBS 781.70]|uniref:Zn(2)-C6 fungal-type domain-containing protein n=1 Tax=Eremomyces bilateralis CBS 781.70 TaxID=1392243 RepID=A0A6G1GH56_9PEZI|nr:uncharacterized protein P152DRAFT_15310 [Eremomyces bilateralis CBS 781.70]KAF1817322.1 hypothetical protein P152DRAFT_15310 [Eremomyces bilateralis CBS 781.70]
MEQLQGIKKPVRFRSHSLQRQRVSKACDECYRLRTKCDGEFPCRHCNELSLPCGYYREPKKRGRRTQKEKQLSQAHTTSQSQSIATPASPQRSPSVSSTANPESISGHSTAVNGSGMSPPTKLMDHNTTATSPSHANLYNFSGPDGLESSESPPAQLDWQKAAEVPMFDASPPPMWPQDQQGISLAFSQDAFGMGSVRQDHDMPHLKYPVLLPCWPFIQSFMTATLACDLLDEYFRSMSPRFLHPSSPYVIAHIFRKGSILHPMNPRACSPALLVSLLWIGAHTSDASELSSPPNARRKLTEKLLDLFLELLRPNRTSLLPVSGSYFEERLPGGFLSSPVPGREENISSLADTTLDDVITYIHLATVVSASEFKASSIRWWNVAWSLARELGLNREVVEDGPKHESSLITEEEREERRRTWWILFAVDRHLSLCYNKPLFLLDAECDALYQPVDDTIWQSGDEYTTPFIPRELGPPVSCTDHSIFGFFLPLMTILGEIIDLNYARNHARFMPRLTSAGIDEQAQEITQRLKGYGDSLQIFETQRFCILDEEGDQSGSKESDLHTRKVIAYGTQVMNTLHILVNGKWDPLSLFNGADPWVFSEPFFAAAAHGIKAAEATEKILQYDPDLSFMPWFFGIQLLQGSLILLLIADKLRDNTSMSVITACETVTRAHEACVVTLHTEYQRKFCKVMRSTIRQVRGFGGRNEGQTRAQEILAPYRWTVNGSGLAL